MRQKTFSSLVLLAISLLFLSSIVKSGPTQKIDLNSATLCELDSPPGIGLSMAERILEFRRENGPFRRVEDLMNVRGIGEKKILKLRDRIKVLPRSSSSS